MTEIVRALISVISVCSVVNIIMAELRDKLPDNVLGKFYVDRQCIDCDVCRDTSPANFTRNDENGYSYVHKQPETREEIGLCEEALLACPVEAIGDDAETVQGASFSSYSV